MVVCVTHSTTGAAVWVLVKTSGAALAYATNAAIKTCDLIGLKECGECAAIPIHILSVHYIAFDTAHSFSQHSQSGPASTHHHR